MIITIELGGNTNSLQLKLMDPAAILASKAESKHFAYFPAEKEKSINPIVEHAKTLEKTLPRIFPEKEEETRIQKARLIMGEDIKNLSDEDLEVYLTEFQYLIDSWLDEYEKQVFNNKMLKELLMEG